MRKRQRPPQNAAWRESLLTLAYLLLAVPAASAQELSAPTANSDTAQPLPEMNVEARPAPQKAPLPEDMPASERARPDPTETANRQDMAPTQSLIGYSVADQPTPLTTPAPGPAQNDVANTDAGNMPAAMEALGNQELVVSLRVNNLAVDAFIPAVAIDNVLFLPVGALAQALEFPVTVDPANKQANGWFIRESRTVKIMGTAARVDGQSYTLTEGKDVQFRDDDIYVTQALIEQWFGLSIKTNVREMVMTVKTDRPLPFEEKLLREKRMLALQAQPSGEQLQLEHIGLPYLVSDIPYVDVSLQTQYNSQTDDPLTSTYTLHSKGDLLSHTAEAFIAGDFAHDALSELRLSMGRKDEGRTLLGGLHASSYNFGDVAGNALTLVASSSSGRGFNLSNRSLYRADQFDTTTFRGTSTPGWDVELYRNDVLLSISTVAENGQYEFADVPIFYGRNIFRIVTYGPQGQIVEETKEYYAGSTLLDKGDFTYNISATDNNNSIFSISDPKTRTAGPRVVGELEYGVNKFMTIAGGLGQLEQADGAHQYATVGVRANFWTLLTSTDAAYDFTDGKNAERLSLSTNLLGIDVRAQHTLYNGLLSDENNDPANLLNESSTLDLSKDIKLFSSTPISLQASANRKTYEDGDENTILRGRIARSIFGINASNTVEKSLGTSEYLKDTLALRGSIWRVLLGASADYNIEPDRQLEKLDFSAQFHPAANMLNRADLQINSDQTYEVNNTLSIDMKKYNLSLLAGATSEGEYFGGVGLNFAFTKLPLSNKWAFQSQNMSETGGAVMRAYLDKNNDGIRNDGEEYLQNVRFRRDKTPITAHADPETAYVTNLIADRPTNINIDKAMVDPLHSPAIDGYEFVPRAGRTAILEFPVYESANLEGTATRLLPSGSLQPLSHEKIELVSQDGVSIVATESEFDGYYLFENIKPGDYTVRIAADSDSGSDTAIRTVTVKGGEYYTIDLQDTAPDTSSEATAPAPEDEKIPG